MGAFVSSPARRTVLCGRTGRRVFETRRDVVIVNKANTREYTSIASSSYRCRSNKVQAKNLPKAINKWVQKKDCSNNAVLRRLQRMRSTNKNKSSPKQQQERIVHDNLVMRSAGAFAGALTSAFMSAGYWVVVARRHHEVNVLNLGGAAACTGATGGAKAGPVFAACIAGVAALIGLVAGGAHGWEAAREADSASAAFKMGAGAAFENVKAVIEKINDFLLRI